MNFEAILFDFDGVLADTMNDNFNAWKKAFENYNIKIKKQDYFPLEGMKLLKVAETISKKYSLNNADYSEIVKSKEKYYFKNNKFLFYQEIPDLIENLKKTSKKLAIVSASSSERIEKTVPKNFLNKFDAIVSGDDTINGKPDAEPYLKAVKKLNISKDNCIIIENAPLGSLAAKNAGIYCAAIETTLDKTYLKNADVILKNHKELSDFLLH